MGVHQAFNGGVDMEDALAAQALRESEELHRVTLLNMSDAVFITNDHGVFTFICPNADLIFGYGPDEIRTMERISRLLGRELVDRELLAASGEIRNIEHEVTTKSGTQRALLVHIKQVAIKGGTTLYTCRDITERKEAERTLRRNEERLTLALEAASMGAWDWDIPTGNMTWSPETHRLLGDTTGTHTPSFTSFLERVHISDRDRVSRTMAEAMDGAAPYETEFRVRGYDDSERWVMGKGKVLKNGKPLRMIGVFVDLTSRHRIERELQELSGRLIHAHEEERIRLSRELHDDLAQRVALHAAELSLLRSQLKDASADVHQQISALSTQTAGISSALHRLSHELHPARLSSLGLETSIRSLCREVGVAHRVAIDSEVSGAASAIDSEVALCLYRITQEALQNVVKHSGAALAAVALTVQNNDIMLSVSDDGAGFDPQAVQGKDTLGLVSMRERARLVKGQLEVTSAPGRGTRVNVRVPLFRSEQAT
jgi:PAS domain S-box-containing protein